MNLVEYARPLRPGDKVRLDSRVDGEDLENIGIDPDCLLLKATCESLQDFKKKTLTVRRLDDAYRVYIHDFPYVWKSDMFRRVGDACEPGGVHETSGAGRQS